MKRMLVLTLVLVVVIFGNSFSQNLNIASVYGSLLGVQTILPNKDLSESSDVSARVGLKAELWYNSSTIFFGKLAWQSNGDQKIGYFFDKNLGVTTLRFGRTATPAALLHQPSPYDVGGHFVPPSLGEISHSDHGVMMINYTGIGKFYSGLYYNDSRTKMEGHISWSSNTNGWRRDGYFPVTFNLSGYVAGDDVFGGAASLVTNFENSPNITITGYAESDSVATLFIEPSFGKFGKPYWDFVYNLNKEQANWEIGWTKKIAEIDTQSKLLIGFGYRENKIALDRTFSVFVWIHS